MGTMRPRHADVLASTGFDGEVDEFRWVLAEVKAELYPDVTDEELSYTRDEAAEFCKEVRSRLKAPKLTRVSILRRLVSLRNHGWAKKREAAVNAQPRSHSEWTRFGAKRTPETSVPTLITVDAVASGLKME